MADQKLSEVSELSAITGDDLFYTVNNPATSPSSYSVASSTMRAYFGEVATATTLAASSASGATTIDTTSPFVAASADQGWAVIGVGASNCEVRKITSVSGSTYGWDTGLDYTHNEGDVVLWKYEPVVNVMWFGAKGDGSTDSATARSRALIQLHSGMNGGTLIYPEGTFVDTGQWSMPYNAGTPPTMNSIRIIGQGAWKYGQSGGTPTGGTIIDLQTTTDPKILTRGLGFLEISGITFIDSGAGSNDFLKTTLTTLHIHDVAFVGNKTGVNCDQDAIVLGGTTTTTNSDSADAAFQGYGTVIENNFFYGIRRGIFGRQYTNGIQITKNFWGHACGGAAALEFDVPAGGAKNSGNYIAANSLEVADYTVGFLFGDSQSNAIIGNSFFDADATIGAGAYIRFLSGSQFNIVIEGFHNDAFNPSGGQSGVDDQDGTNTVLTSHQSQETFFRYPVRFGTTIKFDIEAGVSFEYDEGDLYTIFDGGSGRLYYRFTPSGGANQNVIGFRRNSASWISLELLNATRNTVVASGRLDIEAATNNEVRIGTATQYTRTLNGGFVLPTLTGAPTGATNGMVAYADGTSWNPGSGEGFYGYENGAWVKL